MYETSSKTEVIVKIIGKITLEYPTIDQLRLRDIISKYNKQ